MELPSPKVCRIILLTAAICFAPLLCVGQAVPAGSSLPNPSRVDIFAGYSYLHPINSDIYNQEYGPLPAGAVGAFTGYFNRRFGLQAEYSKFFNDPDYCFSAIQGGPVYRHPVGRLVPFAHVIGGAAQVGPSYAHSGSTNPCTWGWTAAGGVGLDYVLGSPSLHNHLALRLVEGDYEFSDVNYGPQTKPRTFTGGVGQIYAYRLSAGFVYRLGETSAPLPASFACAVQPVSGGHVHDGGGDALVR